MEGGIIDIGICEGIIWFLGNFLGITIDIGYLRARGKGITLNFFHSTTDDDYGKFATVVKRTESYICHTIRDVYIGKTATVGENWIFDSIKTFGECERGQTAAILEC